MRIVAVNESPFSKPAENVVLRWSLNKDLDDLNNTEGKKEVGMVVMCSELCVSKRKKEKNEDEKVLFSATLLAGLIN